MNPRLQQDVCVHCSWRAAAPRERENPFPSFLQLSSWFNVSSSCTYKSYLFSHSVTYLWWSLTGAVFVYPRLWANRIRQKLVCEVIVIAAFFFFLKREENKLYRGKQFQMIKWQDRGEHLSHSAENRKRSLAVLLGWLFASKFCGELEGF